VAKSKSNISYPPIPALSGLIKWYSELTNLEGPRFTSDAAFVEVLGAQLIKDGVLFKQNKNLLYKLIGKPLPSKLELTDSIEPVTLENLSKVVLEKANKLHLSSSGGCWESMQNYFFPMPKYFETFCKNYGYYKYLLPEWQKLINGYVEICMAKINTAKQNGYYKIFMWSNVTNDIITGTLCFTGIDLIVWSSGFEGNILYQENLRSDIRNGSLEIHNDQMEIMLFSENRESDSSLYFMLKVDGREESDEKYFIGFCTYRKFNGELSSSKVVLQACESYEAAKSDIVKPSPDIYSYLINKTLDFREDDKRFFAELFVNKESRLKSIGGVYIFAFLSRVGTNLSMEKLIVGVCTISDNGSVKFNFPLETLAGYVVVEGSSDLKTISIKTLDSKYVRQKLAFDLKVERYFEKVETVNYLDGFFSGYSFSEPNGGKISFIRVNNSLDYGSTIEDCINVYEPSKGINEKYAKDLYERLTVYDRTHWKHSIYYPVEKGGSK